MRISQETLQGYILEEVLAFLIKNTGYKLLTDPKQDPIELGIRGNGLIVKGRGGEHQADVLGQLEWIPTFTFPIRLFVEAKYRGRKTGIETVRNAIGILNDVNQNYVYPEGNVQPRQKYQYNYAIFSTSGFSSTSIKMAIVHNISLIDLSSSDYKDLKKAISISSEKLKNSFNELEISETEITDNQSKIIKKIRNVLRTQLNTGETDRYNDSNNDNNVESIIREGIKNTIECANRYGELLVAMANGPFMLLLKPNNLNNFLEYSNQNPFHEVNIYWNPDIDNGRLWTIEPNHSKDYKLTFNLPEELSKWIFATKGKERVKAVYAKSNFLSEISIYRKEYERDKIYRLSYKPKQVIENFIDMKGDWND